MIASFNRHCLFTYVCVCVYVYEREEEKEIDIYIYIYIYIHRERERERERTRETREKERETEGVSNDKASGICKCAKCTLLFDTPLSFDTSHLTRRVAFENATRRVK